MGANETLLLDHIRDCTRLRLTAETHHGRACWLIEEAVTSRTRSSSRNRERRGDKHVT